EAHFFRGARRARETLRCQDLSRSLGQGQKRLGGRRTRTEEPRLRIVFDAAAGQYPVSQKQRIDQQPSFVLHAYPWRETSLIVEVFSRDHGRVALVAKGARRPHSALRGVLMAFQPLLVDWS